MNKLWSQAPAGALPPPGSPVGLMCQALYQVGSRGRGGTRQSGLSLPWWRLQPTGGDGTETNKSNR